MKACLSRLQQDKAREFIFTQGRKIDQKLYEFFFNHGSADAVVEALGAYRNEDGGFGNGLEPDVRLPASSAIATTIAFQIMRHLDLPESHPFICDGVLYLLRIYQPEAKAWPIVPAEVDQFPHAPWWQYKPELENYLANPRAEILGYLLDNQSLVPQRVLQLLQDDILIFLEQTGDQMEMHDLLCYARLVQTKAIPAEFRNILIEKLIPIVDSEVETAPDKWAAYGLRPLQLVDSPDSVFVDHLSEAIQAQFAFEIANQGQDGAWKPAWTWGDLFPDVWPEVEQEWKSWLTLNRLRQFKEFGLVDSMN